MVCQNSAWTAGGKESGGAKKGAPAIGPETKAFSGMRAARSWKSSTVKGRGPWDQM